MKEQPEGSPQQPEYIEGDSIRTDFDENNHLDLYDKLKGKQSLAAKHIEMAQLTIFKKMLA